MNQTDLYDLLTRYFSGEAVAKERAMVEAWREKSAKNQRLFADFEKIWQNASEEHMRIPDIDQGWNELSGMLGLPRETGPMAIPKRTPRHSSGRIFSWSDRYIWAVAAAILLVFGTMLYKTWFDTNDLQTVATAFAQQQEVRLPDGSVAQLNSGSEIRFLEHFSDSTRHVELAGEAYFEVVHDGRPFIVNTGNAEIKVLGTKFGIWARGHETRVTVREGRVALKNIVSSQNDLVFLSANQKSVCRQTDNPEPPQTIAAEQMLGWLEGKIIFDRTPLTEVIAELHRAYNMPVELKDAELGSQTITGTFQNKQLESVLASICLTLNLHYSRQAGKYIIRP